MIYGLKCQLFFYFSTFGPEILRKAVCTSSRSQTSPKLSVFTLRSPIKFIKDTPDQKAKALVIYF